MFAKKKVLRHMSKNVATGSGDGGGGVNENKSQAILNKPPSLMPEKELPISDQVIATAPKQLAGDEAIARERAKEMSDSRSSSEGEDDREVYQTLFDQIAEKLELTKVRYETERSKRKALEKAVKDLRAQVTDVGPRQDQNGAIPVQIDRNTVVQRDRELQKLKDEFRLANNTITEREAKIRTITQELVAERGKCNVAIQERNGLKADLMVNMKEIERLDVELRKKHDRHDSVLEEQKVAHVKAMREKEMAHDKTRKEQREEHRKAISTLLKTKNETLQQMEKDHRTALAMYHKKHDEQMIKRDRELEQIETDAMREKEALQVRHAGVLEERVRMHEEDARQLRQQVEIAKNEVLLVKSESAEREKKLIEDSKDEIERLNRELISGVAELMSKQKAKEDMLNSEHQQRTQQLRKEVEDLNEAFLNQGEEHYQGEIFSLDLPKKADDKIRDDFQTISTLVDGLSRLDWREDQSLWPPHVFQKTENKGELRLLRIAIVRDTIWTHLFHYVFCSPFRMFGEEGARLEVQWNNACSEDPKSPNIPDTRPTFAWPAPSIKAEQWRYFNVKACRDALRQELSEVDQRYRLKKGFLTTQRGFVTALTAELDSMAYLTDITPSVLEELWRKVAQKWLEFGMSRCRIVIRLNGSEIQTIAEKGLQIQEGSLTLTELPTLGRFGNIQGVELGTFVTLEEGVSRTIS